MFHWFGVVQNTRGDALGNWQVGLVEVNTQTVVPIFSDENGTPIASVSGITNRALSDENGNYDFFVPSGTYTIQFFNSSGVFQRDQRFVAMFGTDFTTGLIDDLASNAVGKGAALIGTEGSGTVQAALDAKTDEATLAASGGSDLVGFIQSGTGAVARTVQDKLRDLPTNEDFTDGTVRGFWTDGAPAGRVWRPLDRAMFGAAATQASGLADPGIAKGWLGFEANGFMTYFETTSQVQSWNQQGGIAFAAAARSSDLPGNPLQGAPIGFASYVTNDENLATANVWAFYGMANREPSVTTGAIGVEVNVANQGGEVSLNPFNMGATGATIAAWLRTGGEVSESGATVAAASVAMGIVHDSSNANAKFLKGIVFESTALKPDGAGNGIAIEMAKGHEVRWIRDGSGERSGWVRSDANAASTGLVFVSGGAAFQNEANQTAFLVNAAASTANYLRVDSTNAGDAPAIIAEGSDTNIDLALTTKGTGVLRFGFHNANADAPINGYIFIKDSGGTLRKLATIA